MIELLAVIDFGFLRMPHSFCYLTHDRNGDEFGLSVGGKCGITVGLPGKGNTSPTLFATCTFAALLAAAVLPRLDERYNL